MSIHSMVRSVRLRLAIVVLLTALFGSTQTGVWELAEHLSETTGCVSPCPNDDGDRCPEGCDACVCCPSVRIALASATDLRVSGERLEPVIASTSETPARGVSHRVFRPPRAFATS